MTDTRQRRGTTLSPAELFVLDQWGRQLMDAFETTPYLVGSAERGENWRDIDVRMVLPWPEDVMSPLAVYTLNVAVSLWGRQVTGLPIDFQMQGERAFHEYDGELRNPLGPRAKTKYARVAEVALGLTKTEKAERCEATSTYGGSEMRPIRCAMSSGHGGLHNPRLHGYGPFSEEDH